MKTTGSLFVAALAVMMMACSAQSTDNRAETFEYAEDIAYPTDPVTPESVLNYVVQQPLYFSLYVHPDSMTCNIVMHCAPQSHDMAVVYKFDGSLMGFVKKYDPVDYCCDLISAAVPASKVSIAEVGDWAVWCFPSEHKRGEYCVWVENGETGHTIIAAQYVGGIDNARAVVNTYLQKGVEYAQTH